MGDNANNNRSKAVSDIVVIISTLPTPRCFPPFRFTCWIAGKTVELTMNEEMLLGLCVKVETITFLSTGAVHEI